MPTWAYAVGVVALVWLWVLTVTIIKVAKVVDELRRKRRG